MAVTGEDKGRNIRKALLIEICGRVSKALVIEQVQREATNPYQAHRKRSRAERIRQTTVVAEAQDYYHLPVEASWSEQG